MKDMKVKPKKVSLRKLKADAEAISPIVATLMLVLIAVAAASAFYIWESGWQNQQSEQLQNNDINSGNLVVSGSTTVNEFMNYASPAFMQNYTAIKVTVDSVGSGAGLKALEAGSADIAMISDKIASVDSTAPSKYPSMVGTTIAYDGIVMIVSSGAMAAHGMTNSDFKMTQAIAQGIFGSATTGVPTITTWTQLAAAMGFTGTVTAGSDYLMVHYRADSSGTADAFAEKMLGSKGYFATTAFSGYTTSTSYHFVGSNGNTGMISDVAADSKAIGFTSYGMVATSGSSVVASTYGTSTAAADQVAASTTTIKNGVNGATGGYGVTRPLILVTMGEPTTIAQQFIDFCKNSANNINFCKSTGFVSLYA
jgi:phosphate transport system substrate-binding protein